MFLKPLRPIEKSIGAPCEAEFRELINVLLPMADNGIKWRVILHSIRAASTFS
jgi:hypothetical protein